MPPTKPSARSARRDPRTWVDRWTQSGLSARAFAAQHGLVAATLYSWRRALRDTTAPTAASPRILPVTLGTATLCEVQLRDGRVLRFPASLAPTALRAFVTALEAP